MADAPLTNKSTQYLVLSTLLILSGVTPVAGDDATPKFLGRTTEQWLARLESRQPQERAEAAWALAQLADGDPPLVRRLVGQDDAAVRYWGMQGLRRLALSETSSPALRSACQHVLLVALGDRAVAVRIAAAEALGLSGQADAALPVLTEAMSHPQDAVRIQAVTALEKLGEATRPAEKTLRVATSDSSEYVKRIATRALQKLDRPNT